MTQINMTVCLSISTDLEDDSLEAALDSVMEALLETEAGDPALSDSGMGSSITERTAEITLCAEGDSEGDAVDRILGAVRSAIHKSGGATPNWPGIDEAVNSGAVKYERTGWLVDA